MFIRQFSLLILLVELLSLYDLSAINDNNNQHQLQITNSLVYQPTLSTSLSTRSTKITWVKTLKNRTEIDGRKIVLECQVKSSYPVQFNWYRYNNPIDRNRFLISESSFRSSIRLRNSKESISGFYTCEVSNGFETLTSNGFVRSSYPDINSIDFKDDLSLSNEFQPEIISPNEQSITNLKCEPYQGTICRSILGSNLISQNHIDIEQNLIDNIKYLSNQCQQFLLPIICLFVYPICDENHMTTKSICRKSCYFYKNNSCMKQFITSYQIPTCENLPPTSDDSSCFLIEHNQSNISIETSSIIQQFLSNRVLILSILLSIGSICLLIIILSFCCRKRSNKISKRLLSSPSTNTNLTHRQLAFNYHPSVGHHILHEIPFSNIRFIEEIGQGDFGRIFLGELADSQKKCLIKTLENNREKEDYSREIEIFSHIHHVNISNLIGICIQPENSFSLMINENFNRGDLHEYLTSQRIKSIDLPDFLLISMQIVSGMIYLTEQDILHNDLAARNILLSDNFNVKITNIARYRRKYHFDYYKLAHRCLPVRWMSIESLLSGIYSQMSDVWSFGILLWEIFTNGQQPYSGQTNPEVIEMIRDRKLLLCPMNCPKQIYILMCSCWQEISEQRPNFLELMTCLRQIEDRSTTTSLIDDELISIKQIESSSTRNSVRLAN